jgi:hypothetical protein
MEESPPPRARRSRRSTHDENIDVLAEKQPAAEDLETRKSCAKRRSVTRKPVKKAAESVLEKVGGQR